MSMKRLFSFVAVFAALVFFVGDALAVGSISFTRRELSESSGGWRLAMTIAYGGKPHLGHVPMRFSFTPTALYERYLDDAHGDKPQMRKIPLSGQQPLVQIIDVGFSDPSGKVYDRTRFEFVITRAHRFEAGEYTVTVHRPDGKQVGSQQKLVLKGDNPIVDRRSISFVDNAPKKKEEAKEKAAPEPAPAEKEATDLESAKTSENEPSMDEADIADDESEMGEGIGDPTAGKVPPSARGCGCRTAGMPSSKAGFALALLGAAAIFARRR